jgi:hypothetical protein
LTAYSARIDDAKKGHKSDCNAGKRFVYSRRFEVLLFHAEDSFSIDARSPRLDIRRSPRLREERERAKSDFNAL